MNFIYAVLFAGLGWWLWLIHRQALEKGWPEIVVGLTESLAFASFLSILFALSGEVKNGPADAAGLLLVSLFFVGTGKLAVGWFRQKIFGGGSDKNHIRGAKLTNAKSAARSLRGLPSRFDVGGIPVPVELETRGFLLAGSPGTGKSQTLTFALDALRADGARGVVADASGIYTSRYFQDGRDVILNPFDNRCAGWSPLAELETEADIPALALSLLPEPEGGEAKTWASYSRTLLEAILEFCFVNDLGNGDLYHLSILAEPKELIPVFAGTPAQQFLAEGNERMFANARSGLADATKVFRNLHPTAGVDGFSIRRHIQEEREGWIFLSYQQQHRDALKSLIAACIDISARAVLSLPPSMERRVIFSLDEMPLLGKVNSIVDLATNGRKHGAMIFAGLQTVAQLRESYGRETSQTLLACLGSWLVLRVADAETAEYMSKYLGEEEKTRIVSSGGTSEQSMQFGKNKSENWQQQVVKDRVVLPSELQSMPDLRGIFNLAGPTPSAWVKLAVAPERKTATAFIPAPPRQRKSLAAAQEADEEKQQVETVVDVI